MQREDMYASVIGYMCENYDYSLYATDFNARFISSLQRALASVPTPAGQSRIGLIKIALHDFFDAIFQKVFIYEDEERLKIVKYFDEGATNEDQDRQIHALRQELVKHKQKVEETFEKDLIYMFDKSLRNRFELALLSLNEKPMKEILRRQIEIVYDLSPKDVVIFLNGRIFVKKFLYVDSYRLNETHKTSIINDARFTNNFAEELKERLQYTFDTTFDFTLHDKNSFFHSYPAKFFSIVKFVVKNSFIEINEEENAEYANIAFKNFLPHMLQQSAIWLLKKVQEGDLKAIVFLKSYSESLNPLNDKMKIDKFPLMDSDGKIYNFQCIGAILKKDEVLYSKIGHKKQELRKLSERVKSASLIVQRSEDEMHKLQNRRLDLLRAIEKVEDEIAINLKNTTHRNIESDRLEFAKRDLLEAFKQVEVRIKTQNNILKNTHIDLAKWHEKRVFCDKSKIELEEEYFKIHAKYEKICEILALAMGKEPIQM